MRQTHAYYCYGIDNFEEYNNGYEGPQNPNLITMKYGNGKKYVFHKDHCFDLLRAIMGDEYLLDNLKKTRENFNEFVKENGLIKTMNNCLKGRGFIMVTDFANYCEYSNGGQNSVVGISGMALSGELFACSEENLFTDEATYKEMYEYEEENEG